MQERRLAQRDGERVRSRLRRLRFIISQIVGIGLLGGLIAFFLRDDSLSGVLAQASLLCVAVAVGNTLLVAYMQSYTQAVQARALDVRLGQLESFALTVLARGGNLLTPFKAGMVFRAAYLKSRHGLALTQFGSLTLGQQVTSLLIASGAGCAALGALWVADGITSMPLVAIMGAGLVVALCAFASSRRIDAGTGWLRNRWAALINGLNRLLRDRRVATATLATKCLTLAINMAVYKLLFRELGSDVDWMVCLLITSSAWIVLLVQVVPGGLGVAELAVTLVADRMAVPAATALTAALLLRAGSLIVIGLAAPPSWHLLRRTRAGEPPPSDGNNEGGP